MSDPTFNDFSLNDATFITERVTFKGFANRSLVRANIARREGVKLLNTEFGEKEVTIEGVVITDNAVDLKSELDSMKRALTKEEGDLVIETGRIWKATVTNLVIPDEHYSLSKAPFQVTFVCSNPFAEGTLLTALQNVPSGVYTFSGSVSISGTLFSRPTVTFTLVDTTGESNIRSFILSHTPSGQEITVSGFGSGGLDYDNSVVVNMDELSVLVAGEEFDNTGAFPRWEPGTNNYHVTVSGYHVGGSVQIEYRPRYL